MREILFRGKRIDNREWVYGFYFEQGNGCDTVLSYISLGLLGSVHIDKNTAGQFTGLTDKNGKKIFEGDIVKGKYFSSAHELKRYIAEVVFCSCRFELHGIGKYQYIFEELNGNCEVIGNIYDDAALEKKENCNEH